MKNYYLKEKFFKITDHYPILDDDGNEVFYLDQDFTFLGYRANLYGKDRNLLFTINKKVLSLFQTFDVAFSNNDKMLVKSRISFLKRKTDIYYKDENIKLKGSLMDLYFEITKDNKLIGKIEKTFFAMTDTYKLTVLDENYTLCLIALCLCLNNMKDTAKNSS